MSDLIAEIELNDDWDGEEDLDPEEVFCWTCGGDGCGVVGVDWESEDCVNGPYPGEIEKCPNCHGSGLAKDCWYW